MTGEGPPPGGDRSFGELATQLVEDAKAYAQAEVDLAKAVAADKLRGFRAGAILLAVAAVVAMGAVNALCVAVFFALAAVMSPILAGILAFLVIGALAALLGWIGYSNLRDAL